MSVRLSQQFPLACYLLLGISWTRGLTKVDDGMPVARASLAVMDMELVAIEPTTVRPNSLLSVQRIARLLLIGVLVILLLPAMVILSAVALLVPCFFRVPVCGTSQLAVRSSSNR